MALSEVMQQRKMIDPAKFEKRVNGFLVNNVEEAAARIVQLVKDEDLRRRLGKAGRETVRQKFLLSRNLEQYLDLFSAFETNFTLKQVSALGRGGRS